MKPTELSMGRSAVGSSLLSEFNVRHVGLGQVFHRWSSVISFLPCTKSVDCSGRVRRTVAVVTFNIAYLFYLNMDSNRIPNC